MPKYLGLYMMPSKEKSDASIKPKYNSVFIDNSSSRCHKKGVGNSYYLCITLLSPTLVTFKYLFQDLEIKGGKCQ